MGVAQIMTHPEIRSNIGVSSEEFEDDLLKSPSPMSISILDSLSPQNDLDSRSADKDKKASSRMNIRKGPDCSKLFINYAVSPTKAKSLLNSKCAIKETQVCQFVP